MNIQELREHRLRAVINAKGELLPSKAWVFEMRGYPRLVSNQAIIAKSGIVPEIEIGVPNRKTWGIVCAVWDAALAGGDSKPLPPPVPMRSESGMPLRAFANGTYLSEALYRAVEGLTYRAFRTQYFQVDLISAWNEEGLVATVAPMLNVAVRSGEQSDPTEQDAFSAFCCVENGRYPLCLAESIVYRARLEVHHA